MSSPLAVAALVLAVALALIAVAAGVACLVALTSPDRNLRHLHSERRKTLRAIRCGVGGYQHDRLRQHLRDVDERIAAERLLTELTDKP